MARFSDGYSGFAGMRISRCASASSSLVSPVRSAPNSTAAGPRALISKMRSRGLVHVERAEVLVARARGGGRHEAAVGDGFGDAVHHARPGQQIVGARGARGGFRVRKRLRAHQHQLGQRHVFHGARHRPDVSGMRGLDEHDANGGQRHGLYHSDPFRQPPTRCSPYSISRSKPRAAPATSSSAPSRASKPSRSKARAATTSSPRSTRPPKPTSSRPSAGCIRDHAILAEESGASGDNDVVWIIDPLDGTTNFMHGFPTFAVSIACQIRGRLEHAVVFDPMRQEIFTASRGDGAQCRRPQDARQQADHAGRRADRHRLPVSRRCALSR